MEADRSRPNLKGSTENLGTSLRGWLQMVTMPALSSIPCGPCALLKVLRSPGRVTTCPFPRRTRGSRPGHSSVVAATKYNTAEVSRSELAMPLQAAQGALVLVVAKASMALLDGDGVEVPDCPWSS